ncbi:MAG: fibronectin type III domain-containing protein, partial [Angustibacter sp.]
FDRSTGLQQWTALSDGDAHGVGVQNGVLYVGGHFTKYSGRPASHVAAVSPSTGQLLPWSISVNSNLGVFTLTNYAGQVLIGGDFTKINRRPQSRLARFVEPVDVQPPSVPGRPTAELLGAASARLSWPVSVDDQSTELTYQIFRDGESVALISSSATDFVSYTDTGLTPGSTHTWQIRAWDDAQVSALSEPSEPLTLPDAGAPQLSKLELLDVTGNGIVDRVSATFTADISCPAPCLAPWVLGNVPSGSTLAQVTTAGRLATLELAEGSGPQNTAVGGMTVELVADPAGVMDSQGRVAGFAPTAPLDAAAPVPVDLDSTPGALDNVMEEGDTFTATFSEPILPGSVQAANVKELDPDGPGNDRLIIVGLTDSSLDLGSDDYVTTDGGTIVYPQATLSLLADNTQIRSTLIGPCAGSACGAVGVGPGADVPFTFAPEPILTDPAGNHATGSYTEVIAPY